MSRHDFSTKSLRPNCEGCQYLAQPKALDLRRLVARGDVHLRQGILPLNGVALKCCIWGVAIKILEKPMVNSRCHLPVEPSPGAAEWRRKLALEKKRYGR